MTKQEQSKKIVYGSLITSTKCYNCIHFPLCFAQKGGANLELASENDCCYYQPKLPKDSVVLSREEYEKLKLELAIEKKRADESYTQKEVEEIVASKERIKGKEMVREIFAKEREFIYSKWKSYITMNDLIELAKQFGVEIKEDKNV